ncbi:MAG: polyphosphate kinase 2 family protein [Chloroflexi bacterium]|nr:polyphosphate kinase 2 family protein [Chloroflexota bacterium]
MSVNLPRARRIIEPFLVPPGKKVSLRKDYDPGYTADFLDKSKGVTLLRQGLVRLAEYQDRLYAQNTYAVLVIVQAMDAAGKDSVIKHVMGGFNPQGCQVFSFQAPSVEELDHDYLWRAVRVLPARGHIGIFNRSYYEEVLVVRVHQELLDAQRLPATTTSADIWQRRFSEINNFEKYLVDNGTVVVKLFLNVSRQEQKQRFLDRIDRPEKNWKFSLADVRDRAHWDEYMAAYEEVFAHTSTPWAPWYIIPADAKWFTRLGVAAVLGLRLEELSPRYPTMSDEQRAQLAEARRLLERED